MTIPFFFVNQIVGERTNRAKQVTREVGEHAGGPQTILGPTLAIPYSIPPGVSSEASSHGVYLVFPTEASGVVKTTTEVRHRSLFQVPVYQADLTLSGTFDLRGVPAAAPSGAVLDWTRSEIVVGVSNARAALVDAILRTDFKSTVLRPSGVLGQFPFGGSESRPETLTLLGAPGGDSIRPSAAFRATSTLRFSGTESLAVLAYGGSTNLTVSGNWPHPGFYGGFLPVKRQVSDRGFAAQWTVPSIARGVRGEGSSESISGLNRTALGISFVDPADPYQAVDRSLKYVLLFVGLVFLCYFSFEVSTGKRVHAAQYLLVGIAQLIFYLLLLSLTERVGFDLGFLLAGGATVALLAINVGWVFVSRRLGVRAAVALTLLYLLIYLLLRLEDNALLVGALASFLAVGALMYFSRRIDWYSALPDLDISPGATVIGETGSSGSAE